MKKTVLLFLILLVFLRASCYADQSAEDRVNALTGADSVTELLPEEIDPDSVPSPEDPGLWEAILNRLSQGFFSQLSQSVGFFSGLAMMILTAAVLENIKNSMENPRYGEVFDYAVILCVSAYIFQNLTSLCALVEGRVGMLSDFMLSLLPITGALWAAGGTPGCALAQGTGLLIVIDLFSALCDRLLLPLVNCLFGLSIASGIGPGFPKINKTVKKAFVTVCVFLMTVLITILGFQTELAKSADGVAMRSVKFAFSSFVPIVGNLVGESARTVGAAVGYIKNTTGFFSVIVILYLTAVPLFLLVTGKLALWLGSLLAQLCFCPKLSAFFDEVNELLSMLMAVLLCVSVYFVLALALFCRTGVNLPLV